MSINGEYINIKCFLNKKSIRQLKRQVYENNFNSRVS